MITTRIDPWTWQERYGYAQAWRVDGATGLVFVAGQGPMSPEGGLVGAGDFEAQARATFLNLGTVLEPSPRRRRQAHRVPDGYRARADVRPRARRVRRGPPAGTVVQVGALAVPGMMLEVEATAVIGGREEQPYEVADVEAPASPSPP